VVKQQNFVASGAENLPGKIAKIIGRKEHGQRGVLSGLIRFSFFTR